MLDVIGALKMYELMKFHFKNANSIHACFYDMQVKIKRMKLQIE